MIYELCIDIDDPVFAMLECARRGLDGPVYAREVVNGHTHIFLEDADEYAIADWMKEGRYLRLCTREDGSHV